MNIAFVQALKSDPTLGCFVFHDVDLIPEDDRNMYSCPEQPRHMSVAIDEMNYQYLITSSHSNENFLILLFSEYLTKS